MKNSRGVQQSDVWAAADALIAVGEKPTIERVRQHMGRGSPNTITPMLDAWFATLGPRLGLANAEGNVVGVMPPALRHALGVIWDGAVDAAAIQWAAQRSSYAEQLEILQEAVVEAQSARGCAEEQAAQTGRALDASEAQRGMLSGQLQALELEHAALNARLQEKEHHLQRQAQTLQQTQKAHESALQQLTERHAAERRDILQRADTEQQRQMLEVDRWRTRHAAQDLVLQEERQQAQQKEKTQQEQITTLAGHCNQLRAERDALLQGRSALEQKSAHQLADLRANAEQQHNALSADREAALQRAARAEREVDTLRAHLAGLQQGLASQSPQIEGKADTPNPSGRSSKRPK